MTGIFQGLTMISFLFAGAALAGKSLWGFALVLLGCVFGAVWECLLEDELREEMEDSRQ